MVKRVDCIDRIEKQVCWGGVYRDTYLDASIVFRKHHTGERGLCRAPHNVVWAAVHRVHHDRRKQDRRDHLQPTTNESCVQGRLEGCAHQKRFCQDRVRAALCTFVEADEDHEHNDCGWER